MNGKPYEFRQLTSLELGEIAKLSPLVLLPIGQVEEHGQHLPVDTDLVIAEETARAVAQRLDSEGEIPVLLMPGIWTSYSGKQLQKWPGTIRIRTRVFADLVGDVIRSLIDMGLTRIIVINSHGHNPGLLEVVAREIADETGVYIAVTFVGKMAAEAIQKNRKSAPGGIIHGCEYETALMLYLGRRVDMSKATDADHFNYHSEFVSGDSFAGSSKVFWSTWGLQDSKTGIYGDPQLATSEFGEIAFNAAVEAYVKFAREFCAR